MAQADTGVPAEVQQILADDRPASELSDNELKQRVRVARDHIKSGNLAKDTKRALQAKMKEARQELMSRGAGGGKNKNKNKKDGADQPAEQGGADDADGADDSQAQDQGGTAKGANNGTASPGSDGGADVLLADDRPASQLSDAELRNRLRQARTYMNDASISQNQRRALRELIKQDRQEVATRSGNGGQAGNQAGGADDGDTADTGDGNQQPGKKALPVGTQVPDDVLAIINDGRAPSDLSQAELKSRLQTGRSYLATGNPPQDVRRKLAGAMKAMRQEAMKRSQGGTADDADTTADGNGAGSSAGDAEQVKKLDGNAADPAAEAKAKTFLAGPVKAGDMSNKELQARLADIRDLLAGNRLSKETERALRERLRAERDILRSRVKTTADGEPSGGNVEPQTGDEKGDTDLKIILADGRESEKLNNAELRRRIDTFRVIVVDKRYSEDERNRWRRVLDRDRQVLHGRLIDDRRKRADKLKNGRDDMDIKINVVVNAGSPPPRDVFAAEVDDEEIEEVLLAPPRRKVDRRYTIEEVEAAPALRETVARIEIDNVHFGFGEAFIREEEVENLDRIAEIMERILAVHPREVFLIEGHTDAVGSDLANLDLSRQRARAIKEALSTFYVIPAANLKTVGYGERFLKIPTAEPEAENRRVSIARATVLLGEASE